MKGIGEKWEKLTRKYSAISDARLRTKLCTATMYMFE